MNWLTRIFQQRQHEPTQDAECDHELDRAIAEYEAEWERAKLLSGECRQGTGQYTSVGEKLCRLLRGHEGPHSPFKTPGDQTR
jgi:hypothetical protein